MESLASELLHEIYTLSCTDGGLTGCSLSLVSKSVRATSRSARFTSVAVHGTSKQLADFLSCFKKERAIAEVDENQYKPVIKHLFFAAAEGGEVREDWRGDLDNPNPKPNPFVDNAEAEPGTRRARIATERRRYREDIVELFRLVSRDLRTLSLVHCNGWYDLTNLPPIECPEGFPLLQELYLYGANPFVDVAGNPVNFPHLTHLRLPFSTYGQFEVLPDWARRAPNVTHLYISWVTEISRELEDIAIGGGPFKKLSNFYLEPRSPPAPGSTCGNPYIDYAMFEEAFNKYISAAVRPITVLPHRDFSMSLEQGAMEEWLDRIAGGVGCGRTTAFDRVPPGHQRNEHLPVALRICRQPSGSIKLIWINRPATGHYLP